MNRLSLLLALSLFAYAAGAQNLNFLDRSATAALTAGDNVYLQEAFRVALNDTPDNEQIDWENPRTGHFGNIQLLDTHEDFDTTCRTVRLFTSAGGREGGGRYRLCLADDDTWRFAPLRQPAPSG